MMTGKMQHNAIMAKWFSFSFSQYSPKVPMFFAPCFLSEYFLQGFSRRLLQECGFDLLKAIGVLSGVVRKVLHVRLVLQVAALAAGGLRLRREILLVGGRFQKQPARVPVQLGF